MDSIHDDIILNNILPHLDGPTLASLTSTSSNLHHLITSNTNQLWSQLSFATWPSLNTSPHLRHVISNFKPHGPRSFFSQAYHHHHHHMEEDRFIRLREFISAVDVSYKHNLIFSEAVKTVVDTDTTNWFSCAPFRVDMLNVEKHEVRMTTVQHPLTDNACSELLRDLTLSWIIIDSSNGLAVNLSNGQPVSVKRHWLTGEVKVQFCTVVARGGDEELVKCGIRVTLGGGERDGKMEVREVSLVMEDMDGKHLNGEGSLVNLEWALKGNKRRRYDEFLEKKRERKEREVMMEQRLDLICVTFGVVLVLSSFLLCIVHW